MAFHVSWSKKHPITHQKTHTTQKETKKTSKQTKSTKTGPFLWAQKTKNSTRPKGMDGPEVQIQPGTTSENLTPNVGGDKGREIPVHLGSYLTRWISPGCCTKYQLDFVEKYLLDPRFFVSTKSRVKFCLARSHGLFFL